LTYLKKCNFYIRIVNVLVKDKDASVRTMVVRGAARLEVVGRGNLLNILMHDPDVSVRRAIPFYTTIPYWSNIEIENQLNGLEAMRADTDPLVRAAVASSLRHLLSKSGSCEVVFKK